MGIAALVIATATDAPAENVMTGALRGSVLTQSSLDDKTPPAKTIGGEGLVFAVIMFFFFVFLVKTELGCVAPWWFCCCAQHGGTNWCPLVPTWCPKTAEAKLPHH